MLSRAFRIWTPATVSALSEKMSRSGTHRIVVRSCVGILPNDSDAPVFIMTAMLLMSGNPSHSGSDTITGRSVTVKFMSRSNALFSSQSSPFGIGTGAVPGAVASVSDLDEPDPEPCPYLLPGGPNEWPVEWPLYGGWCGACCGNAL
jgi:hypothetical protein